MQTPKARSGSLEVPQKTSPATPKTSRQPKTTASESDCASSTHPGSRTPKDRSPKVIERRSPRSPVSELQKKRPSRVSELESQLTQLQEDLRKARDQLSSSESWKWRAQQEAEDAKKQLLAMSAKLEQSQEQLLDLSASEESRVQELRKISQDRDRVWESELEAVRKQHAVDTATLASAMNEIQRLKLQLEMVSEAAQNKHAESAHAEQSLEQDLAQTLSVLENMKIQLKDSKESEAQAQQLVNETLMQLETAKSAAEYFRSDSIRAMEAYNSISAELEKSRAQVNSLEGLVSELQSDLANICSKTSQEALSCEEIMPKTDQNLEIGESDQLQAVINSLKSEVGQLKSALEAAEMSYQQEQIQSMMQVRSAYELVEQTKSKSCLREAELEARLRKTDADIEEMKANLMDKETELQIISEENEGLNMKIEKSMPRERVSEIEMELKKLTADVTDLKANLMDKETELQSISEENDMLKLEIKKWETEGVKANNEAVAEAEAARAAEREALMRLNHVTDEADKNSRRATRVIEQLEAAQVTNSEMEAELRRLKVQSDQWRKAAEAAAAVLSTGNNGRFMERTASLDSNYHSINGKISSPYSEDIDDDSPRKKNGNMLKKIGVLWKKGPK